ncbi:MAG: hypothetical protein FWH57_12330 [Oscillospiraceae bacterium]|nr:hypothetical protein [Oscillospiraceae bacterium]
MKRITVILIIVLLMAGCTPNSPAGTEPDTPGTLPGEPADMEPGTPDVPPGKTADTELNTPDAPPSAPVTVNPNIPHKYELTPSEMVSAPPNTPDTHQNETAVIPPKVNIYYFYETFKTEGYSIDYNILETIGVDEANIATVIESILIEKIFGREIENNQSDNVSPINNVYFADGALTIDYSTAGSLYLDRGSSASYLIKQEIVRTVFSCSLINALDERLNGESETFVNHYSFSRTERICEYDAFIEEKALYMNGSILIEDENINYFEMKSMFNLEINLASKRIALGYFWGILRYFEEMLRCRESLEDVNEEMGLLYSEKYDFGLSITEEAFFTDGKTNYRVLMISSWGLPVSRMYIQIYDDEYMEYRCIKEYVQEGGLYEYIINCDFRLGSPDNYLVIISVHANVVNDNISYSLMNFKLDGYEVTCYNALKNEVSTDIWTVSEIELTPYEHLPILGLIRTEISNIFDWQSPEMYYHDIESSFIDNVFTIFFDNEAIDEYISLSLVDGFWEVIAVK